MERTIKKRFGLFISVVFFALLSHTQTFSQWKGTYGNEWIVPGQPYLKILVEKQGMHRLSISSLPSGFPTTDPAKLQLWYRGKQVAISVSSSEILFFGEKNNGASDSLVYRPETSRMNPHVSLFSDKSAYFLTYASSGKRISIAEKGSPTANTVSYHTQEDVVTFTNQFAFSTFDIKASLNKSYYEAVNTWTGPTLAGVKTNVGSIKDSILVKQFTLKNFKKGTGINPSLELLFTGHNVGNHNIQVYVGSTNSDASMRNLGTVNFTGFDARKANFEIQENDLNTDGSGFIKIKSTTVSTSGDWYSLAYYKLTYPQSLDMSGANSAVFKLPTSENALSTIRINGSKEALQIYDITNRNELIQIRSTYSDAVTEMTIPRTGSKSLSLYATYLSEFIDVDVKNISAVNFKTIFPSYDQAAKGLLNPADFDYLMITNRNLAEGAVEYAEYRASAKGGAHKILVMDIVDIYEQFNYGEPSPIAIRRFVDYMLQKGVRSTHNLFLIGSSVTYPAFMVKELPNEIPTFGDPGADMLLVAGLAKFDQNVPAIPVGRLNCFNNQEILNYLSKVQLYESETDTGWRKKMLHMNGGHSVAEVNQLKSILADLSPIVEDGEVGAHVKAVVKSNPNPSQPQKVDIKADVNEGVGMITFFGHGSQQVTDLDFGYVSDVSRGYESSKKYSVMFFNGCGVGNVFTSRTTHVLSSDWTVTANKGALAVIANSYDSYVSSSSSFLRHLYNKLYGEKTIYTVGEALKQVALEEIKEGANEFEISNFQQSNLQGDPVIKLIRETKSDFVVSNDGLTIYSENPSITIGNSKSVTLAISRSNHGKFDQSETPLTRVRLTLKDGTSTTTDIVSPSLAYSDTVWVPINNLKNVTAIYVKLDPQNLISELNEGNNEGLLDIDWESVKDVFTYSNKQVLDVVAPQISVTFDKRRIMNEEVVTRNSRIEIVIDDDRTMDKDLDLVSVYIKPCFDGSCEYVQLTEEQLELVTSGSDSKQMKITLVDLNLADGKYELLVSAKDVSGNLAESYDVRFEMQESSGPLSLICFPNPASEYVKFELRSEPSNPVEKVQWFIYDSSGKKMAQGEETGEMQIITWYWEPKLAAGIYTYRAISATANGEIELRGKISLTK